MPVHRQRSEQTWEIDNQSVSKLFNPTYLNKQSIFQDPIKNPIFCNIFNLNLFQISHLKYGDAISNEKYNNGNKLAIKC